MAGVLNIVYTVAVVLVAAVGTAGMLWVTDGPDDTGRSTSTAVALAVGLFAVALGASLLW